MNIMTTNHLINVSFCCAAVLLFRGYIYRWMTLLELMPRVFQGRHTWQKGVEDVSVMARMGGPRLTSAES